MGVVGLEQRLKCDHGVRVALEVAQHSATRRAKKSLVGKHLHKVELKQQRMGIGRYSLHEVQQPSVVRELEKLVNLPLRHPLTLLLRQESAVGCHRHLGVHLWPQDQLNVVQCLQPFERSHGLAVLGKYNGVAEAVYICVVLHVLEHELRALPHHQTLAQLVLDLAWFDYLQRRGGVIHLVVKTSRGVYVSGESCSFGKSHTTPLDVSMRHIYRAWLVTTG